MKLIKGNFIYSIDKDNIEIKENQYLLIKDGKAEEFYKDDWQKKYTKSFTESFRQHLK